MTNFDISFGFVVYQEIMSNVYVLSSSVAYGIVGKLYGTFVVTREWDFSEVDIRNLEGFASSKVVEHNMHWLQHIWPRRWKGLHKFAF